MKLHFDEPAEVITQHIAPVDFDRVKEDTETEELRLKEQELSELRLSDPFAYEELMRKHELEMQNA